VSTINAVRFGGCKLPFLMRSPLQPTSHPASAKIAKACIGVILTAGTRPLRLPSRPTQKTEGLLGSAQLWPVHRTRGARNRVDGRRRALVALGVGNVARPKPLYQIRNRRDDIARRHPQRCAASSGAGCSTLRWPRRR
jgi:hypothetical protein